MAESPDQPSCGSNVLSKFNKGYYDGNIRNQYWKSSVDGIQRAYEYTYDGASRLNTATYASTKAGENYALNSVSYDVSLFGRKTQPSPWLSLPTSHPAEMHTYI